METKKTTTIVHVGLQLTIIFIIDSSADYFFDESLRFVFKMSENTKSYNFLEP